jgi:hypothetical protein
MQKHIPKLFLLLISPVFIFSCSSLAYPEKVGNSIPIYENQPEVLDGVYFNEPYSYTYNYKTFLDFLEIEDHNVDSVQVSLVSPERLKVVSYKALQTKTDVVEGKIVNGAFQIKKKKKWFGIPWLIFANSKETIRLSAGVLDEIIVQHYQYGESHFFGKVSKTEITDYYHYSKTLEVIP